MNKAEFEFFKTTAIHDMEGKGNPPGPRKKLDSLIALCEDGFKWREMKEQSERAINNAMRRT